MNPIPVDVLFAEAPKLFAYTLPTLAEREQAKVGDMIKLFFMLEHYQQPRPIWLVVTGTQTQNNAKTFTGEVHDRYDDEFRRRVGTVKFDSAHVYRLPLNRPETENPFFDSEFRDSRVEG